MPYVLIKQPRVDPRASGGADAMAVHEQIAEGRSPRERGSHRRP